MFFLSKLSRTNITTNDIALFFRRLASLTTAGIPLASSCQLFCHDEQNKNFSSIIRNIHHHLLTGKSLYTCLKKYPTYFNETTCHMIQIGEQTGKLDLLLNVIATQQEFFIQLRNQMKQILFYPCVVLITAIMITLVLLLFVIPRFAELYASQQITLPLLTAGIFYLATHIKNILIILLTIGGVSYFYCNDRKTSLPIHRFPIVASLISQFQVIQFTRQLALCIAAGIPLTDAIALCTPTHPPAILYRHLNRIGIQIKSGVSFFQAMRESHGFPQILLYLVKIGEETGRLDSNLSKAADLLEADFNRDLQRFSKLLEPLIMLILGVVIGGLVLGMYLPIFNLGNSI